RIFMQTKQLKQIAFNVANGSPKSREEFADEAIPVLRQDLVRLREKAAGQCTDYKSAREAWTSQPLPGATRPVAIEQDSRHARLVNSVAAVLTAAELVLTFFLSLIFLLNPFFALMLAIVAITALKAGLLATWRDETQPQLTRRRLRRWVIVPSLVVTLVSVVVLVFTRGVFGWLSLLLLPFINWWLCALSIGLLGLSAGLFSLGFLLSWSRHAEKRFDALEREAVATRRVLHQVEKVAEELRAARRISAMPAATASPDILRRQPALATVPRNAARQRSNGNGGLLSLLLLTGALSGGGCRLPADSTSASMLQRPAATDPSTSPSAETMQMELWLDWSLSAEDAPYREALRGLIAAMPDLAARRRVAHIAAYEFSDRGWSAPEVLSLDLPTHQPAVLGEASVLYGQMAEAQARQTDRQYQTQLRERLAAITIEKLLPAQTAEPPCTDLHGVLRRIGETTRPQSRLIFLLTDGHDSCSGHLQPVSLARAALVVVLLPETPRGNELQRPDQAWSRRRADLEQAAPGAVVIPHFGDPAGAAEQAMMNLGAQASWSLRIISGHVPGA
ncbi:MAG: hypothetical protein ACREEM_33255, partial [Blastocatellia bacterium]